jgi:predicted DNA-binding transcriptional regulator YafY
MHLCQFLSYFCMPRLSRTDRLDMLARLLRDRPGATSSELARELNVSQRSCFRDIETLRERGLPVESSRGRGGGLRVNSSWGVSRVLFSRDEALSVLLGLAIAEKVGFPLFASDIRKVRSTITDAFPSRERRRLGPLRDRIFVGAAASPKVRDSYRPPALTPMRAVESAFIDERLLRVEYIREDGAVSERSVEPHALVINAPAWYLLAHDLSRGGARTFRLDRVRVARQEDQQFRARPRELIAELERAGVNLERL